MLTELALKNLTLPAGKKRLRVKDSPGLFVELVESGGKWWRFRYAIGGRENLLSLGTYPEVSIKEARAKRDKARAMIADGIDPAADRRARKVAASCTGDSFEAVTREWHARQAPKWAPIHAKTVLRQLEKNILPTLGARTVGEITAPELLAVLRRIEAREAIYTAHRMRRKCSEIFRFAIATGRAERDPAADLRGALGATVETHRAAELDPDRIGDLLLVPDVYATLGSPVVTAAMRVAPYLFVRPGELRHARWADIDLDAAEWRFTASKTGVQMVVPLAPPVVDVLRCLHPKTGDGPYVFPSARSAKRAMSDGAIMAGYARCGITGEHTSHGWRAVARTHLDETLHFRPDFIEAQLGHVVRDPNGRAYNRTTFLTERREMMLAWASWLDGLRAAALARRESGR